MRLYYACGPRYQRVMLTWRHPRLPPPFVVTSQQCVGTVGLRPQTGAVSPDTCNWQRGLRSLPHLREQFKSRTVAGNASPVYESLRTTNVSARLHVDF